MPVIRIASSSGTRPRRLILAPGLIAGALLLLAACGQPSRDVSAGAPPPPSASPHANAGATPGGSAVPPRGDVDGVLPTLPPAQSRQPERFDAQGCIRVSATESDCGQRAAQLDAAAAGSRPDDLRTLAGFVGKDYTTDFTRDALVVLDDTVTIGSTSESRSWRAMGLVRNERARAMTGAVIEATLRDNTGAILETVRTDAPVVVIRAGEPVPFVATATTTPAAAVASVTWRTIETTGPIDLGARQMQLSTFWTRPYGDPRRIDMYLHKDGPGASPYLLFGSAIAVGGDIARPHVVLAWRDAAGRVVAVRNADVAEPTGAVAPTLRAGGARDFLVTIDDGADAAAANESGPMMWGAGR